MADIKGKDNYAIMPQVDGVNIVPAGGISGQVLKKDSGTDYDYSWQNEAGGGGSSGRFYTFFADQFINVGAEWNITELAPAAVDTNNASLIVRRFDDTTESGVGMLVRVPTGMTNMTIRYLTRAETGAATTAAVSIHRREIPDNGSIGGWSTSTLGLINTTADERWQLDSSTNTLTNWSMTAGEVHQLEFSRATWHTSDLLSGDLTLLMVEVEFD